MILRICTLLFSISFLISFGQKKKKEKDLLAEDKLYTYGSINKNFKPIPFNKRITKFPFDKAAKVQIVSYNINLKKGFDYLNLPPPPKTKADSINLLKYYKKAEANRPLELQNFVKGIGNKKLQESKTLTLTEISELTDVIYNTCNKYYTGMVSTGGCFFPRNAILLYDENDKIFAYFEICFECSEIETSPRKMLDIEYRCEFLYPDLKKFFQKKGLTTDYIEKKEHEEE